MNQRQKNKLRNCDCIHYERDEDDPFKCKCKANGKVYTTDEYLPKFWGCPNFKVEHRINKIERRWDKYITRREKSSKEL